MRSILRRALTLSLVSSIGWLGAASMAFAGINPLIPQLSVTGGTGVPGGTVAVTLALADDADNSGVTAGIDLRFDADRLEFSDFATNCKLSKRLVSTHQLAGALFPADLLNIEIALQVGPSPPPPLGDGELATCSFTIRPGVETGTTAIEIESPLLGNADGGDIPVDVVNGFVTIVDQLPTPTPTSTSTPMSTSTATVTNTPAVTATTTATVTNTAGTPTVSSTPTATNTSATATRTAIATPTNTGLPPTATATATRTGGTPTGATPTATKKTGGGSSGGCNVVPTQRSGATGTAALLLLPALLLWVRRRG